MTGHGSTVVRRAARILVALVALYALRLALAHALGPWVEARERAKLEALVGSLDPVSFAEPPIPDGENAVPAIRAAMESLDLGDGASGAWPPVGNPAHPPTGVDPEELDTRLAAQSAALERLAEAVARPRSSFGSFPADDPPAFDESRRWIAVGRLVALDGSRALARSDSERLRRDLAILHGLCAVLRRAPQLPGQIIGLSVEHHYLDLLRTALESRFDAALLDVSSQIDALRELPGPLAEFRNRGASLLYVVKHPGAREAEPEVPPVPWIRRLGWALRPWSEGHQGGWHWVVERRLAELSLVPRAQWPARLRLAPAFPYRLRTWIDPTVPYNHWSPGILGATTIDAVSRLQAVRAIEQLADLAVHLTARSRNGEPYPEALAELPGGSEPDAYGGEPVRYMRSPDGAVELELRALRLDALETLRNETEPNPRPRLRDGVLEGLRAATQLESDLVEALVQADAEEHPAITSDTFRQVHQRRARLALWRLPPHAERPSDE